MNKKENNQPKQQNCKTALTYFKTQFSNTNKQKAVRGIVAILGLFLIILLLFLLFQATGVLDKLDSYDNVKEVILSAGIWGYALFVFIQFLQVTFVPIPAVITTVAGSLVFGPWVAYGLSLFAVMLGSVFAFWMGKTFGTKLIVWIAGKEDAEKWGERLSRGKYLFFLMLLFPGFPDDILCLVVGATSMSYKFFITSNLIARPLVFLPMVFLGGGYLIPFSDWGILVWIGIVLVCVVLIYLSLRYEKQIETFLDKSAQKLKRVFIK